MPPGSEALSGGGPALPPTALARHLAGLALAALPGAGGGLLFVLILHGYLFIFWRMGYPPEFFVRRFGVFFGFG